MYDAVTVAIVTGTSVRALTSWSMISTANSTPPIGVLKVAAMPAPAPAAIRVMRLPRRHSKDLAQGGAEGGADLDDGALAADRPAAADGQRRSERLDHRDDGPDHALVVIDRIHDLGHAMPLGLRGEMADEEGDAGGAQHRHQDDERAPGARRRVHIGVVEERTTGPGRGGCGTARSSRGTPPRPGPRRRRSPRTTCRN